MKTIWVVVIALAALVVGLGIGAFGGSTVGALAGMGGGIAAGSGIGACSILEAERQDNTIDAAKAEGLYKDFVGRVRSAAVSIDPKADVQYQGYDCTKVLSDFRNAIAQRAKK